MKTLTFLKKTELGIQLLLLAAALVSLQAATETTLFCYGLLAGAQLCSLIVHEALEHRFYPARQRRNYQLAFQFFLLLQIPAFCAELSGMQTFNFIIIPFLAVWQITVLLAELQILNRKAVVHLKK